MLILTDIMIACHVCQTTRLVLVNPMNNSKVRFVLTMPGSGSVRRLHLKRLLLVTWDVEKLLHATYLRTLNRSFRIRLRSVVLSLRASLRHVRIVDNPFFRSLRSSDRALLVRVVALFQASWINAISSLSKLGLSHPLDLRIQTLLLFGLMHRAGFGRGRVWLWLI